ncbi:DUF4145 domain-containing protein [Cobetia amphilecti]|nr:DUF4145 domain-containing protein [Cobetia litoralis]
MEAPEKIKCHECNNITLHEILYTRRKTFYHEEGEHPIADSLYSVVSCNGCESISFLIRSTSEDDVNHFQTEHGYESEYIETITQYPAINEYERPAWLSDLARIDSKIEELYEELYNSLNVKSHVLSAIGIRTILDAFSEYIDIDTELGFASKIKAMEKTGYISKHQERIISDLIEAGNAAAHRGWRPRERQLKLLLEILNSIVYQNLILPSHHEKKLKDIPRRKTSSDESEKATS